MKVTMSHDGDDVKMLSASITINLLGVEPGKMIICIITFDIKLKLSSFHVGTPTWRSFLV